MSKNGSNKEEISFKNITFASIITAQISNGNCGYAYFVDAEGNTVLLYTADGKDFDVVSKSCIIPGYDTGITPPPQEEPNNTETEE
jgi:hypothetical protein